MESPETIVKGLDVPNVKQSFLPLQVLMHTSESKFCGMMLCVTMASASSVA